MGNPIFLNRHTRPPPAAEKRS